MRKMVTVLISLLVLSSGAAILIARAAEPAPASSPAAHAADATPARQNAPPSNAAPAKSTPPKALPPGAPQVPEESATIRDDRTVAPDPKQSADNNVSFPSDI